MFVHRCCSQYTQNDQCIRLLTVETSEAASYFVVKQWLAYQRLTTLTAQEGHAGSGAILDIGVDDM